MQGKTLSAALMSEANFDGADLTETVMSQAYAVGASFRGKFHCMYGSVWLPLENREVPRTSPLKGAAAALPHDVGEISRRLTAYAAAVGELER